MHWTLDCERLSKVPQPLRSIATAAAAGSLNHLERLQILLETLPKSNRNFFLSVFYPNLDPANIPTEDQLDALSAPALLAVTRAWVSLKAISLIDNVHSDTFNDWWPRIWPWSEFFNSYSQHLPPMPEPSPTNADTCLMFLIFVRCFDKSQTDTDIVLSTTGFRYMVARGWVAVSQMGHPPSRIILYNVVAHFLLRRMEAPSNDHIHEILDGTAGASSGAGGVCSDLASLVIKFLNDVVPDRTQPISKEGIFLLTQLLKFVTDVDAALIQPSDPNACGALGVSLIQSGVGFMKPLMNMVYALTQTPMEDSDPLLHRALTYLNDLLATNPGYTLMLHALRNGILRIIVSCGIAGTIHEGLVAFLEDVIPAALMYYKNSASLEDAMLDVRDLVDTTAFQASSIFESWQRFAAFAADRLRILRAFHAHEVKSFKACNDTHCGKIDKNTEFKCCSGCRTSYYCSSKCQKADWTAGGHKQSCDPYSQFRLDQNRSLSVRERSFLRDGVLTSDYESTKRFIVYPQKVLFMARNPGAQFFTRFDYTRGAPRIEVLPIDGPLARDVLCKDPAWLSQVARAARSDGRMELEVVALPVGRLPCYVVVSLRYETPQIRETLQELAAESPFTQDPPDVVRLGEAIRDPALKSRLSGLEIHY
ncbi:hypothetical protein FB451DRAFT_1551251 [Mycena latifolia]|nr:hypothetical protein FB451DRAFT_1551251 [Mycena latifolia]